ncbi:hypothetical protein BJ508DRAFT_375896 [Ascobolus immersus RN42]|uniref:F-box domain-containing protein n=1 Tax=Ascobolus immersus RN42 TaxID=1160509 RepID=A0A3N4I9Q4_ASCIM|nr:hypothetical protein BJ508DRAFT_375896 [Ascobolus immersus RN42]
MLLATTYQPISPLFLPIELLHEIAISLADVPTYLAFGLTSRLFHQVTTSIHTHTSFLTRQYLANAGPHFRHQSPNRQDPRSPSTSILGLIVDHLWAELPKRKNGLFYNLNYVLRSHSALELRLSIEHGYLKQKTHMPDSRQWTGMLFWAFNFPVSVDWVRMLLRTAYVDSNEQVRALARARIVMSMAEYMDRFLDMRSAARWMENGNPEMTDGAVALFEEKSLREGLARFMLEVGYMERRDKDGDTDKHTKYTKKSTENGRQTTTESSAKQGWCVRRECRLYSLENNHCLKKQTILEAVGCSGNVFSTDWDTETAQTAIYNTSTRNSEHDITNPQIANNGAVFRQSNYTHTCFLERQYLYDTGPQLFTEDGLTRSSDLASASHPASAATSIFRLVVDHLLTDLSRPCSEHILNSIAKQMEISPVPACPPNLQALPVYRLIINHDFKSNSTLLVPSEEDDDGPYPQRCISTILTSTDWIRRLLRIVRASASMKASSNIKELAQAWLVQGLVKAFGSADGKHEYSFWLARFSPWVPHSEGRQGKRVQVILAPVHPVFTLPEPRWKGYASDVEYPVL